jgi:hypothetical protein
MLQQLQLATSRKEKAASIPGARRHVHRRENIMGTGNADPRGGRERRAGFYCSPEKWLRIGVPANSPSIDLIIYGLEKQFAVIMSVRE